MPSSFSQNIYRQCHPDFHFNSRVHLLHGYFPKETKVWCKREDELGYGIGGSKVRKFASVIRYLLLHNIKKVSVEGGYQSNNVLGLLPLLKSFDIDYSLNLSEGHAPTKGHAPWIKLLEKNSKAQMDEGLPFRLVEGLAQEEALAGAITLGLETATFLSDHQSIQSIYIDAGTGLSAIGLLLGLSQMKHSAKIYVVPMAGDQASFEQLLSKMKSFIHSWNSGYDGDRSIGYSWLLPATAKSFGAVNRTIENEWKNIISSLVMPIDLTYTAKLFYTVKTHLTQHSTKECLIINAGSWLGARNHSHLL